MGRYLVSAHRSVRDLQEVLVYDLNIEAAKAFASDLRAQGLQAQAVTPQELPTAAAAADIISCATLATEPVIKGQWLQPGVHLDLVGSFTPVMREVDDDVVARCSIFVDTREGALAETGDLIQPIRNGVITEADVIAEFSELCDDKHAGRSALKDPAQAMTMFKSVGASVEDLAAAILAYQRSSTTN
jgi:ornithine cyclodeaminase